MLADISRHTTQKLFARGGLGHLADITCRQVHGIATIGAKQAMAILGLRRTAVDDSYKVICYDDAVLGYDDAVLAFLLGVLADDGLFYNLHAVFCNLYLNSYCLYEVL